MNETDANDAICCYGVGGVLELWRGDLQRQRMGWGLEFGQGP